MVVYFCNGLLWFEKLKISWFDNPCGNNILARIYPHEINPCCQAGQAGEVCFFGGQQQPVSSVQNDSPPPEKTRGKQPRSKPAGLERLDVKSRKSAR